MLLGMPNYFVNNNDANGRGSVSIPFATSAGPGVVSGEQAAAISSVTMISGHLVGFQFTTRTDPVTVVLGPAIKNAWTLLVLLSSVSLETDPEVWVRSFTVRLVISCDGAGTVAISDSADAAAAYNSGFPGDAGKLIPSVSISNSKIRLTFTPQDAIAVPTAFGATGIVSDARDQAGR